jgi:hypothetical protein
MTGNVLSAGLQKIYSRRSSSHERIASEAIVRAIKREDPQIDLFAKPEMHLIPI